MKNKKGSVSVRVLCLCHPRSSSGNPFLRNKNLIRILESFVILPVFALSMPLGGLFGTVKTANVDVAPQIVLAQKNMEASSLLALNQAVDEKAQILEKQAEAIDAYFRARKMPLEGTGKKMAEEAEKNGLDWRLLPAIAVRESTGGKHACKSVPNSFFGWGSCKIGFKSKEYAIEVIARNISGNNPNTEHHYSGKTTRGILQKYNPPSVIPKYADEVMAIMEVIGDEDMGVAPTVATAVNT